MSVSLVIDMNLSPEWVAELAKHGWTAVHWSTVGDPSAEDSAIMSWALANGYAVFTHDLDFGTMLALTHATEADIPGIDDATFQKHALDAKQNCPVSKALAGTAIHLNAKLL